MTQFLTNVPVTEDASSPITLVLNWTAGLEKSWLTKPDRPQFRGFWMAHSLPRRYSRME